MTILANRKLMATALAAMLALPAGAAFGNTWTKHESRTRGTAIGAAAGALLGPPGMVAGAAIGNGVQRFRQAHDYHHMSRTRHHRHHHR